MNTDKITIALTDARPIRVTKALWPLVAKASENRDHNNQELFRRYYIRVRLHGSTSHVNDANEMAYYGADKADAPRLRMHRASACTAPPHAPRPALHRHRRIQLQLAG